MILTILYWCGIAFAGLIGLWSLITLALTAFAIRDDEDGYYLSDEFYEEARKELSQCVVENNCPVGDSSLHRFNDKWNWVLIKYFGKPGLYIGLWGRFYIGAFLIYPLVYDEYEP